jgi:hypothetical protein
MNGIFKASHATFLGPCLAGLCAEHSRFRPISDRIDGRPGEPANFDAILLLLLKLQAMRYDHAGRSQLRTLDLRCAPATQRRGVQ